MTSEASKARDSATVSARHSPGPWQLDASGTTAQYPDWVTIWIPHKSAGIGGHVGIDNARLIASAPDMLAALESALTYMLVAHRTLHGIVPTVPDDMLHSPQIDEARAAIAKAKGEA